MATATQPAVQSVTLPEQALVLLSQVAGYVGHRTVAIGLRRGLIRALADRPGIMAETLAEALNLDRSYVAVWCRGALAAGIVDRSDDGYRLAAHMETLLLDTTSPAYVGGVFLVFEAQARGAATADHQPA